MDGIQYFKWLEEGDPAVPAIYQQFIQGLVPDIRREMDQFYGGSHSDLLLSRKVDIAPCKFLAEANLVGATYNYLIHYYPALAE